MRSLLWMAGDMAKIHNRNLLDDDD